MNPGLKDAIEAARFHAEKGIELPGDAALLLAADEIDRLRGRQFTMQDFERINERVRDMVTACPHMANEVRIQTWIDGVNEWMRGGCDVLISFSIPAWLLWTAGILGGLVVLGLAGIGVACLWFIGSMKGGFWR